MAKQTKNNRKQTTTTKSHLTNNSKNKQTNQQTNKQNNNKKPTNTKLHDYIVLNQNETDKKKTKKPAVVTKRGPINKHDVLSVEPFVF